MTQDHVGAKSIIEPLGTIYTPAWMAARAGIQRIASARMRRVYGGVLDAVEDGWTILRPLVLATEAFVFERVPCWPAAGHVANVAWTLVCELYGSVALNCAGAIPANNEVPLRLGFSIAHSESKEIQSTLHVLGMASVDPGFPEQIKGLIGDARTAFDSWLGRFEEVLQPAIAMEEAVFVGTRRPPVVHTRLRALD